MTSKYFSRGKGESFIPILCETHCFFDPSDTPITVACMTTYVHHNFAFELYCTLQKPQINKIQNIYSRASAKMSN